MRFLLDQDVYTSTCQLLRELGHDVLRASDIEMARSADVELLQVALEQERLFVTRDRDFGSLVFVNSLGAGVIYLRIRPTTLEAVHNELIRILSSYTEQSLKESFWVVQAVGHRRRRIPQS